MFAHFTHTEAPWPIMCLAVGIVLGMLLVPLLQRNRRDS